MRTSVSDGRNVAFRRRLYHAPLFRWTKRKGMAQNQVREARLPPGLNIAGKIIMNEECARMQEQGSVAILDRFSELEAKLDACLVLLKMATTHDEFRYNFKNRSARFVNAVMAAQGIASRATTSVAARHPEHDWAWFVSAARPFPAEMGTAPNETVESELAPSGSSQEVRSLGHRREVPDPSGLNSPPTAPVCG